MDHIGNVFSAKNTILSRNKFIIIICGLADKEFE